MREPEVRAVPRMPRESVRKASHRAESGVALERKSPKVREGRSTSQKFTEVVKNVDGGRRAKTEELDGAGGVCARGSVAT
eukprot:1303582-Pleurochrysis_carterae.AAC.1